jgi:hypothetical protein
MQNQLPFPVNTWSKDPSIAQLVGQEFLYKGLKLLLVKAAASITSPAGQFVVWSDPSHDGSTVSGKAETVTHNPGDVAGLVPATLSGTISSNAYFFVIRGGWEEDNALESVAIFSSAQVASTFLNVVALSCGVIGVQQISSTVQQGRALGRLRMLTSSSLWLTTPGTFSAEIEVKL